LSQKGFCQFAFQQAKQTGIENPFSKEKEAAGRKWLKIFESRNSKLSVKTLQGLSVYWAEIFTLEAVAKFEPEICRIRHASYRL
jgi:hypothetical protein